jgi:hypothetical protein
MIKIAYDLAIASQDPKAGIRLKSTRPIGTVGFNGVNAIHISTANDTATSPPPVHYMLNCGAHAFDPPVV